jgi:acetyl-CoA carboxylase biotin carboxyl carrier protein
MAKPPPTPEGDAPGFSIREVRDLIQMLERSDVHELTIEREQEGLKLTLRKPTPLLAPGAGAPVTLSQNGFAPAVPPEGDAPDAPAEARSAPAQPDHLQKITAPLVGVFRGSLRRGGPAAVSVGEQVRAAQVIAAIESLRVMNEVEAPIAGTITEIVAKEGQPVEYGQHLMTIDTRAGA